MISGAWRISSWRSLSSCFYCSWPVFKDTEAAGPNRLLIQPVPSIYYVAIWKQVTWLVVTEVRKLRGPPMCCRHIFHYRVWHRALFLRYACFRSWDIVLIPRIPFVPIFCFCRGLHCWANPWRKNRLFDARAPTGRGEVQFSDIHFQIALISEHVAAFGSVSVSSIRGQRTKKEEKEDKESIVVKLKSANDYIGWPKKDTEAAWCLKM